ncbi:putative serine/threonine-protein kinase kinX, partial [Leucoagaricus sp. SymC.cos]
QDIKGDWKKLGAGSFGNVYKGLSEPPQFHSLLIFSEGSYLGIDVAIKEVLPSNEYDVAKYFEREWRLMKECRHPNICLFIGLSRAPAPDSRIFIISEYIENGNVRLYIHDKTKPFPWRLRISFATDVTRALAYLHARKCIHRDLKGENLLITSNGRIKVTDFGFARIAARNEEESKRLTFCGTDSYMSPEILLGDEFDLPTDIFSLGIIFCEIAARKLADDTHFKRHPPEFGIEETEVRKRATPDCPPDFINLCLECLNTDPAKRPTTRMILDRLRAIEADILSRPEEGEDAHVGSIKFMSAGKRPAPAPKIPSFGMGVGKDIKSNGEVNVSSRSSNSSSGEDDSDDELIEALSKLGITPDSHWSGSSTASDAPLLDTPNTNTPTKHDTTGSQQYSTSVVRSYVTNTPSSLSSVLTIKPSPDPNATPVPILPPKDTPSPVDSNNLTMHDTSTFSIATMDSYHTAAGSTVSSALATEGGSTIRTIGSNGSVIGTASTGSRGGGGMHRFTSIKPGAKPRKVGATAAAGSGAVQSGFQVTGEKGMVASTSASAIAGFAWNPLDLFFSSGLLMAKCDVCFKRLGWRPVMACDDCGMKAHEKCADVAPKDCGSRPIKPAVHQTQLSSPLQVISPLSKVKKDAVLAGEAGTNQKDKVAGGMGVGLKAKTYGAAVGAKR